MALAPDQTNSVGVATALSRAWTCARSSFATAFNELQQGPRADHTALVQTHPLTVFSSRGEYLPARAFISSARPFIHSTKLALGRVQSLPDQLVSQIAAAPVVHLFLRLSSLPSLVGIDPNENGLTHAQISFAPGAKAYD